jgi:hypothetical protein
LTFITGDFPFSIVFYFINEDLGVRKGLVAAIRQLKDRGEEVHVLDIGTGTVIIPSNRYQYRILAQVQDISTDAGSG